MTCGHNTYIIPIKYFEYIKHDMFKIIHIYVHKINIYTSIVYYNYFNTVQLEDIWLEPHLLIIMTDNLC